MKTVGLDARDILNRMRNIIGAPSDDWQKLSDELQIEVSTLQKWPDRNTIKAHELYGWAYPRHINMHWLLTGSGEVYTTADDRYKIPEAAVKQWHILASIIVAAQGMDVVMLGMACKRASELLDCEAEIARMNGKNVKKEE